MRHRLAHRKLNRGSSERRALLRGLATQLIEHGSLVTTVERAKELRRYIEPIVTLGRVDTVVNRRLARPSLYGKRALGTLFTRIGPMNQSRPGGYTRVLKLGHRPGDNARRAYIEFVEKETAAKTA